MTSSAPSTAHAELPVHLTRFVGRDRELDDLGRLVGRVRLLTLTGAGGSGKTRLAREVAARAAGSFARIAWVDLASLTDPALLAQQVAGALHITERASASALAAVIDAVGNDAVLLALDNCEHLVSACAELAEAVLRACPRLAVLATSREALGVLSETAWLVPPLASDEAVQLFVERACAALPAFAITDANAAAVAEICRRLDGIPLAIELAAARVRVLPAEQIAGRLDDAFRLLSAGSRTALPRHRTLRATMDWSYALLAAREQVLLRRLAIFAGTFTLDAAEMVCAGAPLEPEDILDGVATLVDKSLVVMEPGDGVARYRLLETVRQYGVERFVEAGERDLLEQRFAEYYLALMEAAAPKLVGGSIEPGLIERLATDHDNIRAASAWAATDASRAELAVRFVGALYWLWYALGQFREARQLTDRVLALDAGAVDPLLRGRALLTSALTALAQGEYARAGADFTAAYPLLEAGRDALGMATCRAKHGAAFLLMGDLPAAVRTLDEAVAFTNDAPEHDIARIFARFWRGWTAYAQNDLDTARALMSGNVSAGRRHRLPTTLGHSLSAMAHLELARTDIAHDDLEEVCALATEALELELGTGDGWGIATALEVISRIAGRRGRTDDAVRLIGGLDAYRQRLAVALPGMTPGDRLRMLADLRAALGTRFDAVYEEGFHLSNERLLEMAFAETRRRTSEYRVPAEVAAPIPPNEPAAATDGPAKLRVLALGPLQVMLGGRPIDASAWGSARPRELLVYLLMHPEGRTKEQVGLDFWPDASPAQLRNNFHVTLHRLRKALGGADWVTLTGDRYRVDPALVEELDVVELEREVGEARHAVKRQRDGATAQLEQALVRFRGDFLDGEPVGDWHVEHRDRLQRLYADALMELGARFVAEERFAKAAETYRRLLARDELHEEALQALMRCHAALGERAQALRAYQRFADRMRRELEAEPAGETVRLFERLQQGAAGNEALR
jgi:predicted ATPase/DNA-binding SARP family transcriptional activator